MYAEFDPYHKWLGIPRHEQPPNHYRLLGIQPFEADPEVIERAADRQMAHLRTLERGEQRLLCQRLLNEVAAAKACLFDPAKRAAYDAQVRTDQDKPTPIAPQISIRPDVRKPISIAHRRGKRPIVEVAKIVAGGLAGIVLGVLVLQFVFHRDWSAAGPMTPSRGADHLTQRTALTPLAPAITNASQDSPESPPAELMSDLPPGIIERPALNVAQAATKIGEKVTIVMEVQSTGGITNRYLNSATDFRVADNFAIFIPQGALGSFRDVNISDPSAYFQRKTVQVTGTVTANGNKPQITVTDPAQIKIVELNERVE